MCANWWQQPVRGGVAAEFAVSLWLTSHPSYFWWVLHIVLLYCSKKSNNLVWSLHTNEVTWRLKHSTPQTLRGLRALVLLCGLPLGPWGTLDAASCSPGKALTKAVQRYCRFLERLAALAFLPVRSVSYLQMLLIFHWNVMRRTTHWHVWLLMVQSFNTQILSKRCKVMMQGATTLTFSLEWSASSKLRGLQFKPDLPGLVDSIVVCRPVPAPSIPRPKDVGNNGLMNLSSIENLPVLSAV